MLLKILGKEQFRSSVEIILQSNEIIASKRMGAKTSGESIHQFLPVRSFEEMDLNHQTTEYSAKTYFHFAPTTRDKKARCSNPCCWS